MLVCDGLKGRPEAVQTVWTRTIVQTCTVPLLRNSFPLRGASVLGQDRQGAQADIYTAPSQEAAEERFLEFQEAWSGKYPAIIKLWSDAWVEFVPFLGFDVEIRKADSPRPPTEHPNNQDQPLT
ncbi:transposase [Spirillospora sp. NPDC047279]|uniref:transposase n=1 Tax=Spirillospora sp. NPDC047279 TaxID=3155478 RepID=UPI0034028145